MIIQGKVIKYQDNVNTDEIIPAQYLNTSDERILGKYCMSGIDTDFHSKINEGRKIIVAGKNFGCGSSREHAPVSIKAAGIELVIADSFARIFFRNAINIGLPIIEFKDASSKIGDNDQLKVDLKKGEIENITKKEIYNIFPFPYFMENIISFGGLIPYLKNKG